MRTASRRRKERPASACVRPPLFPVVVEDPAVEPPDPDPDPEVVCEEAPDGVVVVVVAGSALPPVSARPSVLSSDWNWLLIQLRTSVTFSYDFKSGRLAPRRFLTSLTVKFRTTLSFRLVKVAKSMLTLEDAKLRTYAVFAPPAKGCMSW